MHFPVALNPHVQVLYGQGIGLGLAAPMNGLGITPVFKCTSSKCYSTDGRGTSAGTHLLFLNLQRVTNRYAAEAGFKAVTVDGFIGESTRDAVARSVTWGINAINRRIAAMSGWEAASYGPRFSTARAMLTSATPFLTSKVALAGGAQTVYDALKYAADSLELGGSIAPPPPTPITSYDDDDDAAPIPSAPTVPSVGPSYDPYTTSATPSRFAWYLAGGILLAGLGVAAYLVSK